MAYSNLDYLKEFTGDDPEMISDAIQRYLKKAPGLLEDLNKAYEVEDWEKVGFHSHNLYSASQIVGIETIRDTLMRMQQITKETPNQEEQEELKHHLDKVNIAVKGSIEELSATK